MSALAAPQKLCTTDEARDLTERIRASVETTWALLREARERAAWRALNYSTFGHYLRGELGVGRSRSFQLLEGDRVLKALTEAAGVESNALDSVMTERKAHKVAKRLPEAVARIEAGETVDAVVTEITTSVPVRHIEGEPYIVTLNGVPASQNSTHGVDASRPEPPGELVVATPPAPAPGDDVLYPFDRKAAEGWAEHGLPMDHSTLVYASQVFRKLLAELARCQVIAFGGPEHGLREAETPSDTSEAATPPVAPEDGVDNVTDVDGTEDIERPSLPRGLSVEMMDAVRRFLEGRPNEQHAPSDLRASGIKMRSKELVAALDWQAQCCHDVERVRPGFYLLTRKTTP